MNLIHPGPFRLILNQPGPGRLNMAIDEALLEAVSLGESPPLIRLYAFSPPTLSVGRFQSVQGKIDPAILRTQNFVRRPTGGSAVYHKEELTYAVVLGKEHLAPFGKRHVYEFILPLLLAGLKELGVGAVAMEPRKRMAQNPLSRHPDCFARTGDHEVDSQEGKKIIGSAQMITRKAVLQHGSIPISRANREITGFFPGMSEGTDHATDLSTLLGRRITFPVVQAAFSTAIKRIIPCVPSKLTPEEEKRSAKNLKEKYSSDAWNLKL